MARFKSRQLIYSTRTDRWYVVTLWPFVRTIDGKGKRLGREIIMQHLDVELVGNNYQPRGDAS